MSRFYKPAAPKFVDDIIFKLPFQEMKEVLAKKDADIDAIYKEIGDFKKQLDVTNLSPDDEEINNSILEFQGGIRDMQDKLANDYAAYGELLPQMRKMSLDLDDAAQGKFKAAKENKASYDTFTANVDKLKNVDNATKEGLKQRTLQNYGQNGGLNWSDLNRSYNRISEQLPALTDGFDLNTFTNKLAANFRADRKATAGQVRDKNNPYYFENYKKDITELSQLEVREYASAALDQSNFESAKLQELVYGRGMGADEAAVALAQEKEKALQAIVNKVAFKQESTSSSLSPDNMRLALERKAEADAKKYGTPFSASRSIVPRADDSMPNNSTQLVKRNVSLPRLSNNYKEFQKMYNAGEKEADLAFGSFKDQITTQAGMDAVLSNDKLKEALNKPDVLGALAASPTRMGDLNTYLMQKPVATEIGRSGLDKDLVKNVIVNNLNTPDFGEVQVVGSAGLIGTYDGAATIHDAIASVAPEYLEKLGTRKVKADPNDEFSDTTTQTVQESAITNDVIQQGLEKNFFQLERREYLQARTASGTASPDGEVIMDKQVEYVLKIPFDLKDNEIGTVPGASIELRIPEKNINSLQR